MSSEAPTPDPAGHGATSAWVRPVAVILSCLVLGFVGGWVLRGDDGEVTVLAPVAQGAGVTAGTTPDTPAGTSTGGDATTGTAATAPAAPGDTAGTAQDPAATTPDATTGTAPTGTAGTVTAPDAAPADRADVALSVLNGTSIAGLAASTAERAETLGYSGVVTGNAPTSTEPSVVYFRPGARAAAEQAATDLEVVTVRPLPRSGALAAAAPAEAQVVVVLGPG